MLKYLLKSFCIFTVSCKYVYRKFTIIIQHIYGHLLTVYQKFLVHLHQIYSYGVTILPNGWALDAKAGYTPNMLEIIKQNICNISKVLLQMLNSLISDVYYS